MATATLFDWTVDVSPATTSAFQAASYYPAERSCCPVCAIFVEAVERPVLPAVLLDFLRAAGANPLNPQEVWGAPEGGFLNGWWVIGGVLVSGPEAASEGSHFAEPLPGLHVWATHTRSMRRPDGLEHADLLQVEFLWNDVAVTELDREAWPTRDCSARNAEPPHMDDRPLR